MLRNAQGIRFKSGPTYLGMWSSDPSIVVLGRKVFKICTRILRVCPDSAPRKGWAGPVYSNPLATVLRCSSRMLLVATHTYHGTQYPMSSPALHRNQGYGMETVPRANCISHSATRTM
jgi:hypothetical protein